LSGIVLSLAADAAAKPTVDSAALIVNGGWELRVRGVISGLHCVRRKVDPNAELL